MATHHLAQGLASLGRHGDSMLMHVSPSEIAGLQALGQMTGSRLHTNPDTGLPEAFDFGDFFTSLLPTLVGIGLSPATGGASLGLTAGSTMATAAPILGGMATGALVAGANGEDVLAGGLMGGLGGYGGGNLGSSLAKMGGAGAVTPAISSGQGVQLTANNLAAPNLTGLSGTQAASALDASANNLSSTLTNSLGTGTGGAGIDLRSMMNQGSSTNLLSGIDKIPGQAGLPIPSNALDLARPPSGFESLMSGAGTFASDPIGQFDAFKAAGGSGYSLGAPLAMAGISAMQPEPFDMSAEEARRKAEEDKYRSKTTGGLNLSASSGLNLGLPSRSLASGGGVNADQSTISSGGIQDLYGSNDDTAAATGLSKDGYGIGRLDKLAQQGSLSKAGDMFYAGGGTVEPQSGNSGGGGGMGGFGLIQNIIAQNPDLERAFAQLRLKNMINAGYAKGGYLDGQGDGMSDSIPATIEGKQPARLADGEFVVPADVVSHIGNGSSKAGSKRLYAMLDKVRKARTGHTKQGKEINPNKYMPA